MFATANEYWRVDYGGFSKSVKLRMSNVLYLLDDEALIEKLDLPGNVQPIKPMHRQKDKKNGKASILLDVKNQEDENALREW